MIYEKTVKRFCCEDISKIENYEKAIADTTQAWECHHRMELIKTGAVVDSTRQDLIDWGIYYHRPVDELIFLTQAEHNSLHHKGRKKPPRSEEYKRKMSETKKGKRRGPMSEEQKRKLSESLKGKSHKSYNTKFRHWKLVDGKRVYY